VLLDPPESLVSLIIECELRLGDRSPTLGDPQVLA
jgi:hypothetical protein